MGRCMEANSPGFLVSVIHTHIRPPLAENILVSLCTYTPAVCFIGTYTFQNKHILRADNNKSSDIVDFTVFKVLKFAVKHKRPVRRSAFTYCENEKPSRIDLEKSKYGGPFTNEQVEDVNTCLRMVLVIASITATVAASLSCMSSVPKMLHAEFIYTYLEYSSKYHLELLGLGLGMCAILILPVYKVTIRILIKKYIPSTLKRVGSAQILMACTSLVLLVLTAVWYFHNASSTCMLTSSDTAPFSIDHKWVAVPIYFLYVTSTFLFLTAILEFVCAQAPYNLRGLLIGIVYSILLTNVSLGAGIIPIWKAGYEHNGTNNSSCGVWFYLFTTIATTLGCILWCAMAKWYKKRERDEPEMCRIYAENYYDH